jgi:hypothetical protein
MTNRLLLASIVCSIITVTIGCERASEAPPASTAPVVVAPVDAAAPGTLPPPSASAPSGSPKSAVSPYPPTGLYEITTKLVSDTCNLGLVAPAPATLLVQSGAEKNVAKVNVPLPALSKDGARTNAMNRSDVMIEPRRPFKVTTTPRQGCADYKVVRSLEILEVSHDRFKISSSEARGDAAPCAPNEPSKCETRSETTFTLVKAYCEANCVMEGTPRDGGPEPKCICPQ